MPSGLENIPALFLPQGVAKENGGPTSDPWHQSSISPYQQLQIRVTQRALGTGEFLGKWVGGGGRPGSQLQTRGHRRPSTPTEAHSPEEGANQDLLRRPWFQTKHPWFQSKQTVLLSKPSQVEPQQIRGRSPQ